MKIIPLSIPTPFYIGDVNVYLIGEEPLTLIDTGPKTADARDALRAGLRRNGVEFADLKRIVLTHAHEDHCGLAKLLRDESGGAEIFVHGWETGHLLSGAESAEAENLLTRAGVQPEKIAETARIQTEISGWTDQLAAGEATLIGDGFEFEFAGGTLMTLHTPGHTPGSCSFVREANRTLICGDTVLKSITPNPIIALDPLDKTRRFNSLGEFLVSLAKIRNCAPTLVYGGHGEPIYDYEEIFRRYVRAIDDRQKAVIALVAKSELTAFEVAEKLFPQAINKKVHGFLAVSEAVAHLDYAAAEGKITVEKRGAADVYRQP